MHLNDHGIASSGKKRPQTNHAHRSVKEILAYEMQGLYLHSPQPIGLRCGKITSAETTGTTAFVP
jgi:hypothetical protein